MTSNAHAAIISNLRKIAERNEASPNGRKIEWLAYQVAADLLEIHDATGISLDNWASARELCEFLGGVPILENDV